MRWDTAGVHTPRVDFFVSHAGIDRAWAEWVAWQLTEAGYTVELDVWDWATGRNFVTAMNDVLDRSDRVVALLSEAYFDRSRYTTEEWISAVLHLTTREEQRLIPVRVEAVSIERIPAVLRSLIFCDIFDMSEDRARLVLLEAVVGPRRPDQQPVFPGQGTPQALSRQGELAPRLPGGLPQVWNIPARNPAFTGRDALLVKVRERLLDGEKAVVQALHGMGGVGKTQVALEYAHRFARTYDLAWWVTAEQPALIGDQFAALAAEMGCAKATEGTKATQAAVLRELRQRDRWLLVFDNAEDPRDLQEWLPSGNGHVLITSRTREWEETATPVEIDVLDRAESVAVLRERVAGLNESDADRLADQLGDLPLALAQTAGFITATGIAAGEYLALLRTRAREILDESRLRSYPRSLSAAIQLTVDRLTDEDPAAAELASVCAFLAPEPIPLDMITSANAELPTVLAVRAGDPLAWRQTLTHLSGHALARIDQRGLLLHRLTQAILRDRLSPARAAEIRKCTEAILAASNPGDPSHPATWLTWAQFMPHLLVANLADSDHPGLRRTACDACWYLLARGDARSSHDLASQLYERWRYRLGPDDEHTLTIANYLAWSLLDLGRTTEAQNLEEDILARRRAVLGEDHPDTLTTASNLAATLGEMGKLQAARDLAEDTLTRRQRVLGEDNPKTLASASNLAAILGEMSEHQAARDLHAETLVHRRRVLGQDHPDTLVSASNLASELRNLGELQAARELAEDTVAQLRGVLGEDHPTTLASAGDLAATLSALGETEAARSLNDDIQGRLHRVRGKDHTAPRPPSAP